MSADPRPDSRSWLVVSTALCPTTIMLQCLCTHATAKVLDFSREEWNQAFYAPSHPYPWEHPSRVVGVKEWHCAHCGKEIE